MPQEVLSEIFVTTTFRKTRNLGNIIKKNIAKVFIYVGDSNKINATMGVSVGLFRNKKFYEVILAFECRICEKNVKQK